MFLSISTYICIPGDGKSFRLMCKCQYKKKFEKMSEKINVCATLIEKFSEVLDCLM